MGLLLRYFTLSLLLFLFSPVRRVKAWDNGGPTATTYTMITPSPNAVAYPVTRQFQEVHTYVPECAVCNLDNSDCITVYAARTYNWCSTVVPCYGRACTITDCAQWVTFSHANTYALRTTACGSGDGALCSNHGRPTAAAAATSLSPSSAVCHVETIVTRYAVSYTDYNEGRYSRVRVERCLERGDMECEVWYERWVEQVYEEEVIVIVPVTVNTYCPEPTTITYAGSTVTATEAPTTVVFVTESRDTSTVTITRLSTTTQTATAYATSEYSSQSSYGTSATRQFSSMPQHPTETYPRPSPTSYYSTTSTPHYSSSPTNYYPTAPTPRYSPSPSPQHPKYPSKEYGEEQEEDGE
ncbi:hypothetical protein HOY80DRAFT_336662 [Tuber brumale]|nr:hypothetical protein HOY80DRAFT_336662 [Tuber brumale]